MFRHFRFLARLSSPTQRRQASKVITFPVTKKGSDVLTMERHNDAQSSEWEKTYWTEPIRKGRWSQWLHFKDLDSEMRLLLLKSSTQLYFACANNYPYRALCTEFDLPDHMFSWHILTTLHCWMALCRVQQSMEHVAYFYYKNHILSAFLKDCEERMKAFNREMPPGLRFKLKESMGTLHSALVVSLYEYDDGFLGDDRHLAGAIWRAFYQRHEVEPDYLNRVVRYVRSTMHMLAQMDVDELLLNGIDRWAPAEELTGVCAISINPSNQESPDKPVASI